ncbi:hypothetical protein GCM10011574_08250 [Microbispora bryophytorum]|uniref:Uncharacterized protein n=1 Tax=Microbispora bryophytorum TaxID=1460882 RepID=A0A8H9L9H4_9ACTN|nr:hypothetical protein GCM10011574_08250 [Microbispora bryophytorum]
MDTPIGTGTANLNAARVLCAEATWEEDPDQRRALDEVAGEKLIAELSSLVSGPNRKQEVRGSNPLGCTN